MPSGSCFCGNVKINYTAERVTAGLCHCLDCRKLSGSPYTYNFIAHRSEIKVTGSPGKVTKTADSENVVVNYFCSDCGTH
ncbi:hypothetical protein Q7P35_001707 [Cladosporium inversicolor]